MAPDPVPRSRTMLPDFLRRPADLSTRISVSGRGIRTAGVTSNSRDQNSCFPVMYWLGSRAALRRTVSRRAGKFLGAEGFVEVEVQLDPVHLKHVGEKHFRVGARLIHSSALEVARRPLKHPEDGPRLFHPRVLALQGFRLEVGSPGDR